MVGDPDLPGPEKRSPERAVPQAEAQPPLQSDAIPAAGDVPQSQMGTIGLPDARSPFDFRRSRHDNRWLRQDHSWYSSSSSCRGTGLRQRAPRLRIRDSRAAGQEAARRQPRASGYGSRLR